jgi:hypothetical protein
MNEISSLEGLMRVPSLRRLTTLTEVSEKERWCIVDVFQEL